MRAARGNAHRPGDDVPGDGADQGAEYHARVDDVGIDDSSADRLRHMRPKDEKCDEIEERGPGHGVLRPQHARRYDRGDRIGRIVQPIEKIERERHHDQSDQDRKREANGIHVKLFRSRLPARRRSFQRLARIAAWHGNGRDLRALWEHRVGIDTPSHTFSITMPLISFPTSSKRSTTFSR